MRFLFIADPIRKLKPKSDTTLSIVRECLSRSHEAHWCTGEDLCLHEGRVQARVENVTDCSRGGLPQMEAVEGLEVLNGYDAVWIRKDPPFDQSYLGLCWLLAYEEGNVPMLNKPSVLLRYHEKMLPWEAVERGFLRESDLIPTFLTTGPRFRVPKEFPVGPSVKKPFFGHGGQGVRSLEAPQSPDPFEILQPFQPEIRTKGDRRVFVLDGEIIGSFVRFPAEGDIRANLAAGGSASLRDLSTKERDVAENTAAFLKEIGCTFAGLDLIGDKLSEINITSPTGFEAYHELGAPRLAPRVVDWAESSF
jgi:glutathione synthase